MWGRVPFDGALLEGVDDLPVVAELTDEAFLSTKAAAENVGAGKLDYLGQVGSQFPINHLQGGGRIQMSDGAAHLCHNCRLKSRCCGGWAVLIPLFCNPAPLLTPVVFSISQINVALVACCFLTVYQIIYSVHSEGVSSLCLLGFYQPAPIKSLQSIRASIRQLTNSNSTSQINSVQLNLIRSATVRSAAITAWTLIYVNGLELARTV